MLSAHRHRKALRRFQQEICRGAAKHAQESSFGYFDVNPHIGGYRFAPDRRLMIPLEAMGSLITRTSIITGLGDYRQSVYGGEPSLYFDPAKTSNGDGTSGNPYQASQLPANVEPGDVVGVIPGYRQFTASGAQLVPIFNPAVSGTEMARVVYVTRVSPFTMADPLTDGSRSEIGTTNTTSNQIADGASPILGFSDGVSDVTLDGFVVNSNHGRFVIDGGAFCADAAVRCRIVRCYVNAAAITTSDLDGGNYTGLWNDDSTDLLIQDTKFTGFRVTGDSNPNCSAVILYGAKGYEISNCEFDDCNNALYVKGAVMGLNYGDFKKNRVSDCFHAIKYQAMDTVEASECSQSLFTGIQEYVFYIASAVGTDQAHNLTIKNITAQVTGTTSEARGLMTGDDAKSPTNFAWHENILSLGASSGRFVDWSASTNTFARNRDNLYYRPSGTSAWQHHGVNSTSLANYQSSLSAQNANSEEEGSSTADPTFIDTTDFRLDVGSPALTMGSASGYGGAGGEIGCWAGSPEIGRRT